MPRKRSYRRKRSRSKNFVAIPIGQGISLSTLADDTVLKSDPITLGEDLFVISTEFLISLRGLTAGEGPIEVGFAHGDLSITEIKEFLDAHLTDPDDITVKEKLTRPVRRIGMFPGLSGNEVLNNGIPIKTKGKFTIGDGHTFSLWVMNHSGAALTTGSAIRVDGKVYGKWLR